MLRNLVDKTVASLFPFRFLVILLPKIKNHRALFVVLNQAPNLKMLGLLQGFAAGLMLSISFFDLAHNAINSIGFLKGNLWFFSGVLFFAIVANFIPEPTLAPVSDVKNKKKNGDEGGKDIMKKHRRQVLFSGIITAIGSTTLMNFFTIHSDCSLSCFMVI
ncbi:unnamed protein product [Ilex paraguariensis]|uniref:Uncharacterized protein n=1 Tax=Ilex paraguariensis TaxID=185542 RepID=A0ABC8RQH9_9AQUA